MYAFFRLSTMQINLLNLQKEEIDSKIGWTITSLSLRDILTGGQLSRYVMLGMQTVQYVT